MHLFFMLLKTHLFSQPFKTRQKHILLPLFAAHGLLLGRSWPLFAARGNCWATLGHSSPLLGRSWPLSGRSRTALGSSCACLGRLLGRSRIALGGSGSALGRLLAALGPLLGAHGALLAALGAPKSLRKHPSLQKYDFHKMCLKPTKNNNNNISWLLLGRSWPLSRYPRLLLGRS
jgi:hypothetical protein